MAKVKEYMVSLMDAEGNICGTSFVETAKTKPEIKEKLFNYSVNYFKKIGALNDKMKVKLKNGGFGFTCEWETDNFVKGTYYFIVNQCEDYYLLVEDIDDMTKHNNRLLGSLS